MLASPRKVLSLIHGWLGAISAIFIVLIAGSGVMLAFVGELFLAQYGNVIQTAEPEVSSQSVNVAELLQASSAYKHDFQTMGVLMPHSRIEEIETAMVFGMPSGADASDGIRILSIDPYSLQYKGDFALSRTFGHELLDFHHSLLLGNGGIIFVCILSILLIVFLITGLYLWWPKNNKIWRKATTLNLRHNLKQTCFSLHAWFGVWSSMLILYFSITGLALTKPEWFSPLLSPHIYAPPASAGFEKKCDGHITPAGAEMTARNAFPDKQFPNKQLATFFLPNEENGPYYLTYKLGNDNNQRDGDGRVFVHGSCAGLVHVETTETITLPLKITRMLLTLHGGYTFGKTIGQILVVLTGLSLMLLAGTGLVTFFTRTLGRRT